MGAGVLDEIELQSRRLIEQKKQEVAQLAQYKSTLEREIGQVNSDLSDLQKQKKSLQDSIESLKSSEAEEKAKRSQWDNEDSKKTSARRAELASIAEGQDQAGKILEKRESDVTRREKNMDSKIEDISNLLRESAKSFNGSIEKAIAGLK